MGDPYRSENETLRAKLEMAEEAARDAAADLERAHKDWDATRGYSRSTLWSMLGLGFVAGIFTLFCVVEWRDARTESPPAPSALVIHNAWCYRAHDLSYGTTSLNWTTQHGTQMGAAYDNVTVVIPRCTQPRCWDDAYEDALIEDAGDCQ